MIKTLRQSVFLRLTLFFALGIIIQTQKNLFPYWIYSAVFSLLILTFAMLPKIAPSYRWRWLFGAGLFLFCTSSAGILTYSKWMQTEWKEDAGVQSYRVQLIDDPERKPQTWMCKVKAGDKTVLIYIPVDSASSSLKPSDWLIIKTHFEKTGQINLRKQNIAARAFVAKNNWRRLENQPEQSFSLHFYSLKCRRIVLSQLKKMLPDEQLYTIATSISFGYTKEMDRDTRRIFTAAGCAHILAISGLHFAFIYSALNSLFSFIGNKRRGRVVKQFIILPILWAFAFFTGMHPSVVRAVITITIWGIGNAFFYRALTFNTLGFAAFLLLLYNPLNLFDIGFQLSFSAVLAILLINPYLTAFYHSRNPAINYVWEMSCTSTSAQLGTAPLSIYYFHQFPLLYLIANLFAIPLAGIFLLLIPLSLLASFLSGNHPAVLFPLQKLLQFFITGLNLLAEIPNGVVTDLQLTVKDTLNLTLGIVFSCLLIIKRRILYLYLLVIIVILQVLYYLCPF